MKQIKHPEFKLCYVSHSPVISRGTLTSPWTLSMSGWMETPQLYPSLKASIIRSSRVFATFFFVTWRIPRFGKLWEINWASHTIVLQASLRVCVRDADLMVESLDCRSAMQIPLSHCFPTRLWACRWGTGVSAVTSWTTTRAWPW